MSLSPSPCILRKKEAESQVHVYIQCRQVTSFRSLLFSFRKWFSTLDYKVKVNTNLLLTYHLFKKANKLWLASYGAIR